MSMNIFFIIHFYRMLIYTIKYMWTKKLSCVTISIMKKSFKKIFSSFLAIIAIFMCIGMSGCVKTGVNGLEFGTKYYQASTSTASMPTAIADNIKDNKFSYLIFNTNKTGKYLYYKSEYHYVPEDNQSYYTYQYFSVKFTYTKIDASTVLVSYKNSDIINIETNENINYTSVAVYTKIFTVSKNILVNVSEAGIIFMNEKYLKANGYID